MTLFRTSSLVLVAVLVAGCADPAGPGATSSTTTESPMPTPSTEPTGPQTPRSADDGVAISIAQLPIGGGSDDSTAAEQCVTVSWLQAGDLPGNGVKVTGIRLSPAGAFSAGGGCGGMDACSSFTFHANGDSCSVAVKARGTGGSARLTVGGKATCASASACRDLRDRVRPASIGLTQPDELPGSSTPETTTTTG